MSSDHDPQQRYSEQLITIPGMGVVFDSTLDPVPPATGITNKFFELDMGVVRISLPWPAAKTNALALARLRAVVVGLAVASSCRRQRVELHFFSNIHGIKSLELAALKKRIEVELQVGRRGPSEDASMTRADSDSGVAVIVHPTLPRDEFIAKSQLCHLALDAYPFGGCLTVLVSV